MQHSRHFVYLRSVEEGWSPPPSTVARVTSQQTKMGGVHQEEPENIYRDGVVREVEVSGALPTDKRTDNKS